MLPALRPNGNVSSKSQVEKLNDIGQIPCYLGWAWVQGLIAWGQRQRWEEALFPSKQVQGEKRVPICYLITTPTMGRGT